MPSPEYTTLMARIKALESKLRAATENEQRQLERQIAEAKADALNKAVETFGKKLDQCIDYQNLYALEEDFNRLGLTLQTTNNNRMIICKLREGKIVAGKVIDDYIFVGSLAESTKELSDRAVSKIKDFVRVSASEPSTLENKARVWRNGLKMYESSIAIVNEDIVSSIDVILEG